MLNAFYKAIPAGMMISIGAAVFLLCDNKAFGAIMFTVGLLTICTYKLNLYTGKIGYVIRDKSPLFCLAVWLGNLVGCLISALAVRFARPDIEVIAENVVAGKLSRSFLQVSVLSLFCGVLIYIAVDNFINNSSSVMKLAGLMFCVPVFILCGFEHSIADMCYFLFCIKPDAGSVLDFALFILNVSVFNGVGSLLFRAFTKDIPKKSVDKA